MMSTMAVMTSLKAGGACPGSLQDRMLRRKAARSVVPRVWVHYLTGQENLMSYVQRVLQPGEVVRHTAMIHWIVYWPTALCVVAAIAVLVWAGALPDALARWAHWLAALLGLVAVLLLIREWFGWWTTEVAVTNLRVIYKTGLIKRRTNEMHMDKVESVQVDQSIMGRILDYGTVTITGTGVGLETLTGVARPIELRNSITGVAHH
jgi:membrane protein YdbS with pleckstrin-like domain